MGLKIEPAKPGHVDALLLAGARDSDWRECFMTTGGGLGAALRAGLAESEEAAAAYLDGELAGLFGVARRPGHGAVWLAGTERLSAPERALRLTRTAKSILGAWQARYGRLACLADPGNAKGLAWLERLGFRPDPDPARGPLGHALWRMWRSRPHPEARPPCPEGQSKPKPEG